MKLNIKTVISSAVVIGVVVGVVVAQQFIVRPITITPNPTPTGTVEVQPSTTAQEAPPKPEDFIHVTSPTANDFISSPVTITGEAKGTWFFEASFPVILLDPKGKQLAAVPAQAQGDWMTEKFVPFKVKLTFKNPGPGIGTLILKKDNPSGLPEHEMEIRIPVRFEPPSAAGGDGEKMPPCIKTGCSAEVCSDQKVATNCIYKEQYVCYKTAKCERQTNGSCGWTPSPTLDACLAKYEDVR